MLTSILFFVFSLSGQDFEVSPVVLKFELEPGLSETRKLFVTNHAAEKATFEMKLYDYTVDEKGKKKNMAAGSSDRSCAAWLSLNPSIVDIAPNETKEIEVTMTVPKGAYDTRWSIIAVQAVKEKKLSEVDKQLATGILITPRIVVLVSQSAKSNKNAKAKLLNFKNITTEKDTLKKFTVDINNIGDKIIEGKVYLTIANINTGEEESFPAKKIKSYPGAVKNVELELPKNPAPGQYAIAVILDYGSNTSLEGAQMILDVK